MLRIRVINSLIAHHRASLPGHKYNQVEIGCKRCDTQKYLPKRLNSNRRNNPKKLV